MAQRTWGSVFTVSAAASALATLSCCLPAGMFAAVGALGLAAAIAPARPWLLGASVVFLVLGYVQLVRGVRCQRRPGRLNLFLIVFSTVVVVTVLLFPDIIAGFLADIF